VPPSRPICAKLPSLALLIYYGMDGDVISCIQISTGPSDNSKQCKVEKPFRKFPADPDPDAIDFQNLLVSCSYKDTFCEILMKMRSADFT